MQDLSDPSQEDLISKLDRHREWLLRNLDQGKWSEMRIELAELEREISKLILRVRECNSEK
tara:strand:- start:645 stop:827 length:183 start_codon:yes stop_codon:yes gene_type:complete